MLHTFIIKIVNDYVQVPQNPQFVFLTLPIISSSRVKGHILGFCSPTVWCCSHGNHLTETYNRYYKPYDNINRGYEHYLKSVLWQNFETPNLLPWCFKNFKF